MRKNILLRKLLPLVMLAAMLLTTIPAAAAFHDTAGHWAEKTLNEWQDKGFIDGCGDGSFRPDGTMTRAEFAKLVNRTMGFTAESAISFSDVTERDWFYAEVAKAVAAGYAQGSGGAFRPNQPVTRAEAAGLAASIPAWARGSVGAVAEAVVTLDRVLKSTQETALEKAGTTLENETVAGDLVIAESVGEGNVTLKNVTVLGSVIVKGGGANSIYFDSVRVGGTVRLEKEGVHLRLTGDTALERVEIGLPCRITQDGTFEGALGALVIDLAKDSAKEIQIEVPAKRVELLSRASVSLGADVGELQIGKDAEGAQLEVKRGASVGELNVDAKIRLTGDGAVISLVVSVSGVTVSGTLTVEKTETEGGAEAPATSGGSSSGSSGGSSGGSSAPVRIVTGAAAVADVTVDHGTSEADAMSRLPASITLNVTENGAAGTVPAAVSWALDKAYSEEPRMDTVYTATGTVTIPDGYTYDGTLTVTALLTVRADPGATITGISEVMGIELPYGAAEGDVQLPVQVTVENALDESWRADVRWTLDGEWASPGVNTYKGIVIMPAGHYYNGEMDADITATVTVAADGVTPKTKAVVDYVPLPITTIGYVSTEELVLAAARPNLPTSILLECEDGSYIAVTVSANDWYFTYAYIEPNTRADQTLSLKADAVLPMGYDNHDGKMTVYCSVEVKALNKAALESALAAAKAQLDTLTEDEAVALADNTKLYVAANGTRADSVMKGVKFVERYQTATLKDAYAAARSKNGSDAFASQTECDRLAQELQEASDAFGAIEPNVGTLYTNKMILEAVKNESAVNPENSSEFAYSAQMQPLKSGSAYRLYIDSWSFDGIRVAIEWEAQGEGAQYVEIKSDENGIGHYERNGIQNLVTKGALITGTPDKPVEVRFVATVKDFYGNEIGKLGTNGEYTATIGVPMCLSGSKADAPLFASGDNSTGEIYINLDGVEAIKAVDASKITIAGLDGAAEGRQQINDPEITDGAKSLKGVCLKATLSMAMLNTAQNFPISGSSSTTDLKYVTGAVTVTIKPEALTLDESKGWYFPETGLTQEVVIWVCNPQLGVNTQMTIDNDHAKRNISVSAKYIGDAPVQVAYTKTRTAPDGNDPKNDSNVWVWVENHSSQAATNSDGERVYSAYNVEGFGGTGDHYIWCRAWEGANGEWLYTNSSFVVN